MRKFLIVLCLMLCMVFLICSCGNGDDTDTNTDTSKDTQSDTGTNTDKNTDTDTDTDTSAPKKYSIVWFDENGNVLFSDDIVEGEAPSYSYEKTDTAEWDYTFEGWSLSQNGEVLNSIPNATEDARYFAIVSKVKQTYTVIFNSNGGSNVEAETVEYGALATLPSEPTYEGHKFISWCTDLNGENPVDFNTPITGNVEYYAIWNEVLDVKALLERLLEGYEINPYSYIPESMRLDYSANLVNVNDIIDNYSSFVNIEDISTGFGEQWHMVIENLEQSKIFFNVLSVVESLATTSITSFNNYFDKNPSDTAHHTFESSIYNVTINFDGESISYILDYTAELPVLGEQTVQIALSMDTETSERAVRIQLGDANALSYKILENSYEFAIKYLGVRRAMFSVARDDEGNVSGSIYEYLTVSSAELASACDFYITEDYVSVVGNKASGMLGFTGYINELYDVNNGKLIGYEVQETLSSIVYNTLWFDLKDINGINTIKYQEAEGKNPAKVFVNGSSTAWEAKKVGGISLKMASRRFDIEFRTQYVYTYNATEGKYSEHKINVPMIFVQEENYETFIADVKSTNDVTINILVDSNDVDKVLSDYDTLIPIFIENKDKITPDSIVSYIGEKLHFNKEIL